MPADVPLEERHRRRLRDLADALERSSDVRATDLLDDPARGHAVLEVVLRDSCDGVRPCCQRIIAKHGGTILDVTPKGAPAHPIATVA